MTKNPEKKMPRPVVKITRFMRAWYEGKLTRRNKPKIPGFMFNPDETPKAPK